MNFSIQLKVVDCNSLTLFSGEKALTNTRTMSIKKQYLKDNKACKVTFSLKKDIKDIEIVRIPGDFNNWDTNCEPMKKLKSGGFTQTLKFDAGRSYEFKYLINDSEWRNESEADRFEPNNTGPDEVNSVLDL